MKTESSTTPTVKVVSFLSHNIRTVTVGEDVLFCSKDAHEAAGFIRHTDSFQELPEWGKRGTTLLAPLPGQRGGPQMMPMLSEAGLYFLYMHSRKPQARELARWVCCEVLPAIRKYGYYAEPGVEIPPGLVRRTRALMRLNACRSAVLWNSEIPDHLSTISAFLKSHGIVLSPCATMRFARRCWNANGQRYDSPRLYAGRNRFPVLYPKAVLGNVLDQAKADSAAGQAWSKEFIETVFSSMALN